MKIHILIIIFVFAINSFANATFDCVTELIVSNGEAKKVTHRQAKSTAGMTFKINPKHTRIIVETEYKDSMAKFEAKFIKQFVRIKNGIFTEDLTKDGLIYDMYIDDDNYSEEQYYVPSGVNNETIMTNIIKFATNKKDNEQYILFSKCWNDVQKRNRS